MRHRDLSRIKNSIPLWPAVVLREAAQDKANRRPISTSKRGLIKCSGKSTPRQIAQIRTINLARVTQKR